MKVRGGCWSRGIGTFGVQGESPRINRRLRPFGRWLPTYRPIRTCEVARAEKARANVPSIWPPRKERHQGVVLFISPFFLNFNPSVPSSFSLAYFLLSASALPYNVQMVKKFFPLPPLRIPFFQLSFFLLSVPHVFSLPWKLDTGNAGFLRHDVIIDAKLN